MKSRLVVAAVIGTAFAAPLGAQCASAPIFARQACYASVDLVNYMTPQLATAVAGGSSTLGQSGALGGLGRFALSIRGTGVMNGAFPNIGDVPFRTDSAPQSYTTEETIVPGVGVDASFGIWKGFNLGATHIGAVDALVSALYIPDIEGSDGDFSVTAPDGNLKLGYGVRVGILDESVLTPGVYVSYLQRDLPTISLSGSSGGSSGSFALNDFSVKMSAVRIVAAKTFLIFGLQAGVGQDSYKASADIVASESGQTANASASMSMTRTNVFAGAMINFFVFKLVAEAGQVSGGSLPTPFNTFDKPASDSRTYLSGGLRIAF
ncbi:MAG: hypothetical protein O2973_06350 [Gemmatimonadetes bacterium]|nr:hypothetical protein [Gemmatimonadota bacterium]